MTAAPMRNMYILITYQTISLTRMESVFNKIFPKNPKNTINKAYSFSPRK